MVMGYKEAMCIGLMLLVLRYELGPSCLARFLLYIDGVSCAAPGLLHHLLLLVLLLLRWLPYYTHADAYGSFIHTGVVMFLLFMSLVWSTS